MTIDPLVVLTPTENLVVEVLIARYRLGERLWTFNSDVKQQVEALSGKGYVVSMNGVVPKTVRAMLTDAAIAFLLTYDYVPPIAENNPAMTETFREVTRKAATLKERLDKGLDGYDYAPVVAIR